jgi:hypothetical protein
LETPVLEESFREGNLRELKSITLADKSSNNPLNEIAESHYHFVSNTKTNV